MRTARSSHTATVLANGKVLVTGGATDDTDMRLRFTASAELYDVDNCSRAGAASHETARVQPPTPLTREQSALLGR
jgi:hypothetical protein